MRLQTWTGWIALAALGLGVCSASCGSDDSDGGNTAGSGGGAATGGSAGSGGTGGTGGSGGSGGSGGAAGTGGSSGAGGSGGTGGAGGAGGSSGTGGATGGAAGDDGGAGSGGSSGTGGVGDGGIEGGSNTGTGQSSSQVIGASGGTIDFEMVTLTIPAGALAADTTIKITSLTTAATSASGNVIAPVYRLEPAGTSFAQPVSLTFHDPAAATGFYQVVWTSGTTAMTPVTTNVNGTDVTGSAAHFSCTTLLDCLGDGGCPGTAPPECNEAAM